MPRPVIGIVTTWFERGAAYVSRAYRDALDSAFEVQIYARGGERCAPGDPRWDGPEVWVTFNNFFVISRYNLSPLYSLAAWQLSEEIANGVGAKSPAQ